MLHPAAEKDLEAAAEFYEQEASPAVAARFVQEFKRLASLLLEQPGIGAPCSNGRRGLVMNVFPYTAIYRATTQEVRVLVVKHDRKQPSFGDKRV